MEKETRGRKRKTIGIVVSDKMDKTISVRTDRLKRHPLYGKSLRRWTTFAAHDENNECRIGDTVEIMETRPLSKKKRWRLVRMIQKKSTATEEN